MNAFNFGQVPTDDEANMELLLCAYPDYRN